MVKKIRLHKSTDYDIMYGLCSNKEYPISSVIKKCLNYFVNNENEEFEPLTLINKVEDYEIPKDMVLYITVNDKKICELFNKIKKRQLGNFIKSLFRAYVPIDFTVFFISGTNSIVEKNVKIINKPILNQEIIKEEKNIVEIPKKIQEEIIPKEKYSAEEPVVIPPEENNESSSDFDMMSCLEGMFENF